MDRSELRSVLDFREDSGGGLGGVIAAVAYEGFCSARYGVAVVAMIFRERTSL
jgi:hypothetical protein